MKYLIDGYTYSLYIDSIYKDVLYPGKLYVTSFTNTHELKVKVAFIST